MDILYTDQGIDGLTLLDMIEDLSEFKEVLPKAGDRLAIKRLVGRLQTTEKVLLFGMYSKPCDRRKNAWTILNNPFDNHKKISPNLCVTWSKISDGLYSMQALQHLSKTKTVLRLKLY